MPPDPPSGSPLRRSRARPLILPLLRHCDDINVSFISFSKNHKFEHPRHAILFKDLIHDFHSRCAITVVLIPKLQSAGIFCLKRRSQQRSAS